MNDLDASHDGQRVIGAEDAVPATSPSDSDSEERTTNGSGTRDDDPHDLISRFIRTHQSHFARALTEIKNGQKRSCWSWYLLPAAPWIVNGVESGSYTNMKYSLRTDEQAKAYLRLRHDGVDLRRNYLDLVTAMRDSLSRGVKFSSMMGFLDDPKARASLRLFERISREVGDEELNGICREVMSMIKEAF